MISETILSDLLALATAEATAHPRARKRRGALRRAWTAGGVPLEMPPELVVFDAEVPLSPSDAMLTIWLACRTYNAGGKAQQREFAASVNETIAAMAAIDEYVPVHGVWSALHRAGVAVDHSVIAARVREMSGPEAGERYVREATRGIAILADPHAVVSVPPVAYIH